MNEKVEVENYEESICGYCCSNYRGSIDNICINRE